MKVVVDTNVIAYLLLDTKPFVEEVREFWRRVSGVSAPASWEAELTNVLWLAGRHGVVTRDLALAKLGDVARLGIQSHPVSGLWQGALVRAFGSDVAAYDTLFVELAARLGQPLVTFDQRVLDVFPTVAVRPKDV